MQLVRVRLKFKSPLHVATDLGVGHEGLSITIHSDTLYSAILTIWNNIDPETLTSYLNTPLPGFYVSSAFPYMDNWEFYPKPMLNNIALSSSAITKKYNKVEYVERTLFDKLLHGNSVTFDPIKTIQNGMFWINNPDTSNTEILHEKEAPRVIVDRVTHHATPYYVSQLYFDDQAGLYFWLKVKDDKMLNRLVGILRFMGDEGIGLDRNCGYGHFEIYDIDDTVVLPGPQIADQFLTLSLYHPQKSEITKGLLENCAFETVKRGGYVSTLPYRRKTVLMFTEGSVFTGEPVNSYGDRSEVLDNAFANSNVGHPVYRYGYAFPVGFRAGDHVS